MPSSTYSAIEKNSKEIWNSQYYKIVYEYDDKVIFHLPPPLNIIGYLVSFIYYLVHHLKNKKENQKDEELINEEIGKNYEFS